MHRSGATVDLSISARSAARGRGLDLYVPLACAASRLASIIGAADIRLTILNIWALSIKQSQTGLARCTDIDRGCPRARTSTPTERTKSLRVPERLSLIDRLLKWPFDSHALHVRRDGAGRRAPRVNSDCPLSITSPSCLVTWRPPRIRMHAARWALHRAHLSCPGWNIRTVQRFPLLSTRSARTTARSFARLSSPARLS